MIHENTDLGAAANSDIRPQSTTFSGNILLFYAFDIGDDIDLQEIKQKRLLFTHEAPRSAYFKNYHIPLSFNMGEGIPASQSEKARIDCLSGKIHHFGVISFCYKIPYVSTFEDLKSKLIAIERMYDKKSEEDARAIFKVIASAIKKPCFFNLKNSYFAVQVNPLKDKVFSPEEFKELYGSKIASLLRLETENLSDYQVDDILASVTGYYGQDLIIIDSEASFVYDNEYFEPMEFFELTTIQKLELQYFDHLLDKKLNFFYSEHSYKIPLVAYIPLLGGRAELPVYSLAKLRVDISVVTERLENSIKLAGEAYYENLYAMLVEQFSLPAWKDSIHRKLDIIQDLYTVHQDNLDTIRNEVLTVVIIILIALELFMVFIR